MESYKEFQDEQLKMNKIQTAKNKAEIKQMLEEKQKQASFMNFLYCTIYKKINKRGLFFKLFLILGPYSLANYTNNSSIETKF